MGNEDRLRSEALSRLKRRRDFMSNLGTYLLVNGLLWLIWGFVLFMHAFRTFLRRPITEADIQREMQRRRG